MQEQQPPAAPAAKKRSKKPPRRPLKPRARLTTEQVSRLNIATTKHPDTIRRWAAGARVTAPTDRALSRECLKLGIEVLP